ncbi:hypothetical protein RF11_13731 [Thelohanellus kitauei]|uniref:Uncharacterized protein n=1 Tax=Thelohanellus kitauei TaxID=669202 RepID=A0A0C2IF26_THEKT|nr:hypothetical protein RF11_13731 [Thelohanellus kitauei]
MLSLNGGKCGRADFVKFTNRRHAATQKVVKNIWNFVKEKTLFVCNVHLNSELKNKGKFAYLLSYIEEEPLKRVNGITPNDENYQTAIDIPSDVYGNPIKLKNGALLSILERKIQMYVMGILREIDFPTGHFSDKCLKFISLKDSTKVLGNDYHNCLKTETGRKIEKEQNLALLV